LVALAYLARAERGQPWDRGFRLDVRYSASRLSKTGKDLEVVRYTKAYRL